MAKIRRWDPFSDLLGAHGDLNRLFDLTWGSGGTAAWVPALDLFETESGYEVRVDLPGLDPDKVDVSVEDHTLTISGSREATEEMNEDNVHRVERRYGSFTRSLTLPKTADVEKIEASFDKGVLSVSVPKAEQAKPKRIQVKAAG